MTPARRRGRGEREREREREEEEEGGRERNTIIRFAASHVTIITVCKLI